MTVRALSLITVMGAAWLFAAGCAAPKGETMSESKSEAQASQAAGTDSALGELKISDQVLGEGAEAVAGKAVSVHYTGRLLTGRKFDSSLDRGQPFRFNLGAGQVIQGWDVGVAGMKVGGKRQLTIPPHMGYGAAGAGGVIPPNATLVFDVELLGVE
jgi:FKBP-type peptidyl-prolyl cis-trans isomerase FkpA